MKIGITERGDAALDFDEWAQQVDKVDGVILITKNPELLLKKLQKSKVPRSKCIVHCTITGWGGSLLEPNTPPEQLVAHRNFIELLGPKRTVLRIDPIIPTVEGHVRAQEIFTMAEESRVRISFLDLYKHVRYNLKKYADEYVKEIYGIYGDKLHAPIELRKRLASSFPDDVEICGEPGMNCSGCVSKRDLSALGLELPSTGISSQRSACKCAAVKTELLSRKHPCAHGCLYCYWR